jgi:nitroimidazol reductase NimA-like FMN-containing flavoprotein (pyridoxamine 5'-phosphate oxidase superfamily)
MTQRELEELSRQECLDLLEGNQVGRIVYHDDFGPVAEPVNFVIVGESIVLRVEGGSKRRAMGQSMVAFEVDQIDTDNKSGWSVIARGVGQELDIDELPALIHELRQKGLEAPLPWASGIHNVWLQIPMQTLSGRRLGRESSPIVF